VATLREKWNAVFDFLQSSEGLDTPTIKGLPDFQRDKLVTPLLSLYYTGSTGEIGTISARVGTRAKVKSLDLNIYASNESELFDFAELLEGLRGRSQTITLTAGADNQDFTLTFGDDTRVIPDPTMVKQERHLTICTLQIVYK